MRLDLTKALVVLTYVLLINSAHGFALEQTAGVPFEPINAESRQQLIQFDFGDSPTSRPIQGLKIKSRDNRKATPLNTSVGGATRLGNEPYAFAVWLKNGSHNQQFCEALVRNLQFLRPEVLALAPQSRIRITVLYDQRPAAELDAIARPYQLSKDDCDELVPNHDFDGTLFMATRLGVRIGSGGPWIVIVDPGASSAIIFDLAKQNDKFDASIDQVIEVLHDPELWRSNRSSIGSFLWQFWPVGPRIQVVPVPADFPR